MFLKKLAVLAGLWLLASSVSAQDLSSYARDYSKLVSQASDVVMLDERMFGDQESLYTGGLSFSNTDVSLPGPGPSIALTRNFSVKDRGGVLFFNLGLAGDWEIEVPHLVGIYASTGDSNTTTGWNTQYSGYSRCSAPTNEDEALPGEVDYGTATFHGTEYWSGTNFVPPGGGSQELMLASSAKNPNRPTSGGPYKWVVNNQWYFSCLTKTSNGFPGEGFLALGPDGTQVWLDHMAKRYSPKLSRRLGMSGASIAAGPTYVTLSRQEVYLYATKVRDRFGNTVTYTYDPLVPGRLTKISGSEGRTLTLTYNAAGKLQKVSDGTRNWTYAYAASGSLQSVTLPDQTKWTYDLVQLSQYETHVPNTTQLDTCTRPVPYNTGLGIGTVTHPSGATGTFTVATLAHGRSYVDKACRAANYDVDPSKISIYALNPKLIQTPTIVSKQITGPGLPAAETWTYSYDSTNTGSFAEDCSAGCPTTTWTKVRGPTGDEQEFTFGNRFHVDEGRLYRTRTSEVSGSGTGEVLTLLRDEQTTFASATGNPFPAEVGMVVNVRGDFMAAKLSPVKQTKIIQQGVTFTRTVNTFDKFANPLSVTRESTGAAAGDNRITEVTEYNHDLSRWVLGQVKAVKVGTRTIAQTDYYSATVLPWKQTRFGILQATLAYNADGSLATVTDGLGNKTAYSNWYRGIPRSVTYANGTTESATVNADGTIASVTDELSYKTSYEYVAGRLSKINYPSGAEVWAPTTRSFAPVASEEYGIDAGHWKQVVQTGNGRTSTFYDAHWRPVLVLTEDATAPATRSFVVKRYDGNGREVFSGYPVATLSSVSDPLLKGIRTSYDALGRVSQVKQGSELGWLTTTTEYLSGFQTRVTKPRGFATTTAFQVFDQPATGSPVRISLPEGVTTAISRDAYGKPLSIKRSGGTGSNAASETRSYVYDSNERLCKTVNPESGATIVDYDLAGNIAWSADGLDLTTLVCDRSLVATGARTTRSYDALNRPIAVSTPGGVADVTTSYFADGAVKVVTAANPGGGNVSTTYSYNNRRLLTAESQANGEVLYSVIYGYNGNGHLATLTYPDEEVVAYAPDALGRPTQVAGTNATYASGVTYHPNGAIAGFKYGPQAGPGPSHTMLPNERLLPLRSQDMLGSLAILDDEYSYDENANVLDIYDRAQKIDRAMAYDGLDRLTHANADNLLTAAADDALWGVGTYTYDALDNLRSMDQGSRNYRYSYDANWRLEKITDPLGAEIFTFDYDAQGNTIAKNSQTFAFDSANRMNSALVLSGVGSQAYRYDGLGRRVQTTDPDSKATFWLYTQAGQVLYSGEARRRRNLSYIYLGGSQIATRAWDWDTGAVTVRYQMTDALGSPVADTDTSGGDVKRTSYTPWGEASPARDGAGYTGHVMDADTGLTYMQQRYYDPSAGRFYAIDPSTVELRNASNFARFSYAANDPFGNVDPDGRDVIDAKEGRKIFGKGTTGLGHHWVPFGSLSELDVSREARAVFGQAVSGNKLENGSHNVEHPQYNKAVTKELQKYAKVNGIDLSKMTQAQARAFVAQVRSSSVPEIRRMVARVNAGTTLAGKAIAAARLAAMPTAIVVGIARAEALYSINQQACISNDICNAERMNP